MGWHCSYRFLYRARALLTSRSRSPAVKLFCPSCVCSRSINNEVDVRQWIADSNAEVFRGSDGNYANSKVNAKFRTLLLVSAYHGKDP